MLFLVATPIGNLSDISFRAVETLRNSDLILCEDTRHSALLLNHFEIKRPLRSYHKFNESRLKEEIISLLKEGKTISLISDAGTPCINDPGYHLVKAAIDENINVTAIPGASSVLMAAILSGFDPSRFQFLGFLPKKPSELKKVIDEAAHYPGLSIALESCHRVKATLSVIEKIAHQTNLAFLRELTKKFEQIQRGTATKILETLGPHAVKGECVLVFEGGKKEFVSSDLSIDEHIQYLMEAFSLSKKDAIKLAAEQRGLNKRELYRKVTLSKDDE